MAGRKPERYHSGVTTFTVQAIQALILSFLIFLNEIDGLAEAIHKFPDLF